MKPEFLLVFAMWMGIALWESTARAIEPAAPAAIPATQPSAEVAALIGQLGDSDFHVRLEASRQLRAMGSSIIAAMKEARKSQDPEIHARAEEILASIDHPLAGASAVPKATGPGVLRRIMLVNGFPAVVIFQPGRTIQITQDQSGISMKVTGELDGREVTREFKARSGEQLSKDNPEAFELFRQFSIPAFAGQVQGNAIRLNALIAPVPVLPLRPRPRLGDDNLDHLEDNLLEQMKTRHLPDGQQEEVKGLLKQLREGRPQVTNDANMDVDARMREYNRRCDEFRKRLAELNLPDPGAALPPPASGRLGVSAMEDPVDGQGMVITHVMPDSRAARLGLKDLDLIRKINGQEIHSMSEFRKAVTDHPKGLIVEGVRDGQPFSRQERAEPRQP